MAETIGTYYFQLAPSAEGVSKKMSAVLGDAGKDAGGALSGAFSGAIGGVANAVTSAVMGAVSSATQAVGDFAVSAVKAGMDFDSAMSQVAATMGTSVDEIGELRDFAQQMGSTTAFSATQAAESLNYMALAGYDATKSMEMLPTVLDLAAAGGIGLAYASDMVTDASSALGLTTEQTALMVDQMAMASSKSNTSVSQLGEAMLTIGATARNVSGGTEELATMLGVLADNGIKGSEGGTHLRNILLAMNPTTEAAAKAWEMLGVATYDAYGNLRPMPDVMTDLAAAMDGMTDEEKNQTIASMFNKTDLAAVNALLGTSAERYEELSEDIAGAWYSEEGFQETLATYGTSLQNMRAGMSLLGVDSETFDKILKESGGDAEAFVDALWEATNTGTTYDDVIKGLSMSTTDLQDALDGVEGSASKMSGTQLDNLAGDITLFNSALEGAQIAVSDGLTPTLREFVQFGAEGLSELTTGFKEGGLAGAAEALGGIISDGINTVLSELPGIIEGGANILLTLAGSLAENASLIMPAIQQVIETLISTAMTLIPQLLIMGNDILMGIVQGITKALPDLIPMAAELISVIATTIAGFLPENQQIGMDLLMALGEGLTKALPAIISMIPPIIDALISVIIGNQLLFIQAGTTILESLLGDGNLNTIIKSLVDNIPAIIDAVIGSIIEAIPLFIEAGFTLFVALVENLPGIIGELVGAVIDIEDALLQELANLIVKFEDIGGQIMQGLADGIVNAGDAVVSTAKGVLDKIPQGAKDLFQINSPSKLFEGYGEYLDMGLALGIESNADVPQSAMTSMAQDVSTAFTPASSETTNIENNTVGGGDIVIPVYIGQERIDEIIVNATNRVNYKSGGRS